MRHIIRTHSSHLTISNVVLYIYIYQTTIYIFVSRKTYQLDILIHILKVIIIAIILFNCDNAVDKHFITFLDCRLSINV